MNYMIEAVRYWQRMADTAPMTDLTRNCEAPCNAAFVSDATALCYLNLESPFEMGCDADNEWQDMMYFFRLWRDYKGSANCAYRMRFIKIAKKLVDKYPRCPFLTDRKVSFERLCEEKLTDAEWEDMQSGTYVPVTEPAQVEKKIEREWKELQNISAIGKVENEPPAKVFNVFKKKRKKGGRTL